MEDLKHAQAPRFPAKAYHMFHLLFETDLCHD